jgi:hypothetical protein
MFVMIYGEDQYPLNRALAGLLLSIFLVVLWSCIMFGEGRTAAFKQLGYHEVTHPMSTTLEKIKEGKK